MPPVMSTFRAFTTRAEPEPWIWRLSVKKPRANNLSNSRRDLVLIPWILALWHRATSPRAMMDYVWPKICAKWRVISNNNREHSMVTDCGWSFWFSRTSRTKLVGHGYRYRNRHQSWGTRGQCVCLRGKRCGRCVTYANHRECRNT